MQSSVREDRGMSFIYGWLQAVLAFILIFIGLYLSDVAVGWLL